MYRETIEHPWSIADDIEGPARSGKRPRPWPDLSAQPARFQSAPAAAAWAGPRPPSWSRTLANPNSWWRETAQRLLFERQDRSAAPGRCKPCCTSGNEPLGRLHALWTLSGLGAIERSDLLRAIADEAPGVREHGVLLAEPRLARTPNYRRRVGLAKDDDMRVRFQVALSLGEVDDPRAAAALGGILRRDLADRWMRAAVMSADRRRPRRCWKNCWRMKP